MVFSRQDLGHRVVVRRVIGQRDGRPLLSETLGHLEDMSKTELTIRTSAGTVQVPLATVTIGKRVPDQRRPARREVAALEIAASAGWPAPITGTIGQWLLRSAGGWTGRANSALPVGDPGMPVDQAIEAVVRWYAGHGQPALINVPLPYAARLDAVLAASGWQHRPPTRVETMGVPELIAATPERPELPAVTLSPSPSPAWLEIVAGRKGGLPDAALHILTSVDQIRFAEVHADTGELLAIARGAVTSGWLGISVVEVVPAARRRGLARHAIGALARWSAGVGASRVYLQVEERNARARALYAKLGFTLHHTYLTRYLP